MPDTLYGQAATIANLPRPAATVNISSSTNATPIVVTTAAAHGLQTGYLVIINGHLVNTAANGIRKVTVLTSTTFSLQTVAGANVAGVGVGAATGTVQSLALAGFQVPTDLTDLRTASSVNVAFTALADMVFFLAYTVWANLQILGGGTLTIEPNAELEVQPNGLITNGGTLTNNSFSVSQYFGRSQYTDPQRPADAATISVDAADGDTVLLPDSMPNIRTVEVADSTLEGERITIIMPEGMADGEWFNVKRADATQIAKLYGWTNATESGQPSWVELQVEGGVWRGRRTGGVVVQGGGW